MVRPSVAATDCRTHEWAIVAAGSRRTTIVGNRSTIHSDSMRDASAAGTRFSSREPRWTDEQHSGGDSYRRYCPIGIFRTDRNVRLVENRLRAGKTPQSLRGSAAKHDRVVRALAAPD